MKGGLDATCVRIRGVAAYLGSLTKGDSKSSCSLYMAAAFQSEGSSLAALSLGLRALSYILSSHFTPIYFHVPSLLQLTKFALVLTAAARCKNCSRQLQE